MEFAKILESAGYLLALLNPVSKIMFLASYQPQLSRKQNFELTWKSSLAALVILVLLAAAGKVILTDIFRVQLYSLQITGGLIVFLIGFRAVSEGRFTKEHQGNLHSMTDVSLVPLAAPLIAGPGMIAAVIAMSAEIGLLATVFALCMALAVNFLLMIGASGINRALDRTHLLGPLIRLTGLIIAAVAMQMMISGLKTGFNW